MTQPTLIEHYKAHEGRVSDKWSLYLDEYERLFAPHRNKPIHLLEIGVQNGGSLEIWAKYFPQAQQIVGCDINPACAQLSYTNPTVNVVVGDVNKDDTLAQVFKHAEQYDIVIDDGSHTRYHSHILYAIPPCQAGRPVCRRRPALQLLEPISGWFIRATRGHGIF